MPNITPNKTDKPRWLLDTEKWTICEWGAVEEDVKKHGYGIISYTWGRWASWDQQPPGLPNGLQWRVPVVKNLPLSLARSVVSSMKIRYVWWDWMCVPQGTEAKLGKILFETKGEEVGKQMSIYRGARKSIVWLHLTEWRKNSPVEKLLINQLAKQSIPAYLDAVDALLREVQKVEPWLTSGWTLQEGVLLTETLLLDHQGKTLRDDRFFHNDGQAFVLDLTAGLTTFAIRIATAFLKLSAAQDDGGHDEIVQFIRISEKNYQSVAQLLSRLLRSGLIAYTKSSPLYILAGKLSRIYSGEKDQCWALLGALDLSDVTPSYRESLDMDRVKSIFFESLLKKHQWSTLLVAGASADNQKLSRLPWHTKVTDGLYLPLGIYLEIHWKPNLPRLSWTRHDKLQDDVIHIQSNPGAPFTVTKLREKGSALCRRYEQVPTLNGNDFIRIVPVKPLEQSPALFLPIADLESRSGTPGARYIEIVPTGAVSTGRFRGVVDIWATKASLEEISFTKLSMPSGV